MNMKKKLVFWKEEVAAWKPPKRPKRRVKRGVSRVGPGSREQSKTGPFF
jgi:hypothetical protein